MTVRAVVLGLLLGLLIAGATYFNDQVIRQTYLIGNHLPAAVFGLWLVVLLGINPLLARLGEGVRLRAGELAIVLVLGLAVCGWPGSNLLRYFSGVMAKPAVMLPTKPAWQAQRVMSYLPGGSPLLAEGFVRDYPALVGRLQAALRGEGPQAVQHVVALMTTADRYAVRAVKPGRGLTPAQRREVVEALNRVLRNPALFTPAAWADADLPPDFVERLNAAKRANHKQTLLRHHRRLLEVAFPGLIRAAPEGEGVLLADGRRHPVATDLLISGREGGAAWPGAVPWGVWWPTLRLWIGTSLLLGLASLCLVLVVHPQWSRREMLPYPTARFVEEIARTEPRSIWPAVTRERLFWFGFIAVLALHTLNGLHAWFNVLPQITLEFALWPLRSMFPNASQVYGADWLWHPKIFFAVIGFGFFIPTRVSLSLGLALPLWVALGALMLTFGTRLETGHFNLGANGSSLRFGAYLGLTLLIAYFGRRYYWQVTRASVGLARGAEMPQASVRAARGLVIFSAAAVALLVAYAGLTWLAAALLVLLLLMIFLVLTRLNVETGLFYAQPDFLPAMLLGAFFGAEGLGPTSLLVLTLASVVLVADPREAVAPYLANGLRVSETVAGVKPGHAAWPIGASLVLGLIAAMVATLSIQYAVGLNPLDTWSNRHLPAKSFDVLQQQLLELSALGQTSAATGLGSLGQIAHAAPMEGVIAWTLVGLALVLLCALARLRLPWWPLHPVLFIVWGTYPSNWFAFSFLLAAGVKWATVSLGGAKTYHRIKPLMVGLIAAELLAVVLGSAAGTIYYFNTGLTPESYRIFP